MKKGLYIILVSVLLSANGCSTQKKVTVVSPDGTISFEIMAPKKSPDSSVAHFSLDEGSKKVLLPSSLDIKMKNIESGDKFRITGTSSETVNISWINNFGERKVVQDNYNQTRIFLECEDLKINLICRAYNEGVAFAYEFPPQKGLDSVVITDEKITFRFPEDHKAWSASRAQAKYSRVPLSKIEPGCERPLVIEYDSTVTIALAEAKLVDYSRMKFDPDSSGGISIKSRLDGEVNKKLPFQSPWRVIMIGKNPGDLLEKNYLLLNLNDPCAIEDVSWIKPGKVLREVTLTTTGARAAIDFTSSHNMQYVEFDAGWYGPENRDESDARAVNLDPARSKGPLDIKEVIRYANSKNIQILLYVNRKALEKQLDSLLPIYKKWGIAGIKFGFVQVGNQKVTAWLHDAIKKVASYQMVADVHDEYRPTGFSRTYPNFLTMEGIRGDEGSREGSRPFPTNYIGDEPELEFFNNVPTVWDDTKVLYAKIAEYGVIARQKGYEWFIGGINGEEARTLDIRFSFLTPGVKYSAKIYSDDPAVNTRTHVRVDRIEVDKNSVYPAKLPANNGIAMHIVPVI